MKVLQDAIIAGVNKQFITFRMGERGIAATDARERVEGAANSTQALFG
jgi:hypothetical protein